MSPSELEAGPPIDRAPTATDELAAPTPGSTPADWVQAGWPALVVLAALVAAYLPNIMALVGIWNADPDYSHGYLVIPIALAICWQRWPRGVAPSASLTGWVVVVLALVARQYFHYRGSSWSENATLIPVIVGLGLARTGWPIMRQVWPAFAFLIFLLPLPASLNSVLSQPLQKVATLCSVLVLKATGLWVLREGNVIVVDSHSLHVEEACNGLAMLMSLSATVVAAASLIPMSLIKRVILLVSVIPVALLSNILRISATAWAYHSLGAEIGSKKAHDMAGWLMMPTAMGLVALELMLVSWLVVETDDIPRDTRLVGLGGAVPNLAGGPR